MADNNLNFDLDAPAVPTLTLDPTPAAVPQEEKPAAAPAPEAQVNLTPEEQAMVDQFAQKIDITNSQQDGQNRNKLSCAFRHRDSHIIAGLNPALD